MTESGIVRYPRAWLNCGGGNINLKQVEVNLVRLMQPSTFEAVMALDDPTNPGAAFWASAGEVGASVTIDAGDGSGAQTIFNGHLTHTEVDFGPRTVRAVGKDGVDTLIGTRNDQPYVNTPTTGVVSQIAGQAGLGTVSDGGGSMAGRTYDYSEYRYNTDVQSGWDAIQEMAYQEGKCAFCGGTGSIYFVAPNYVAGNYNVTYTPPTETTTNGNTGPDSYDSSNVALQILCGHDCTLQGGSSASSDSMFSFDNKTYTGKSGGGSKQFYEQNPGHTEDQVQSDAARISGMADPKQWTLEVLAPGDTSVRAQTGVTLSGTGTAWDQLYAVKTVTHTVSVDHGYVMEIVAYAGIGSSGGG